MRYKDLTWRNMISNPKICKKNGILDMKWGLVSENQKSEDC